MCATQLSAGGSRGDDGGLVRRVLRMLRPGTQLRLRGGREGILRGKGEGVRVHYIMRWELW